MIELISIVCDVAPVPISIVPPDTEYDEGCRYRSAIDVLPEVRTICNVPPDIVDELPVFNISNTPRVVTDASAIPTATVLAPD